MHAIVIGMKSIRSKRKAHEQISSQSKLFVEAEKRHIQAHLALTELRLRLSTHRKAKKRPLALDILHDYWKASVFPSNTLKANKRTPIFIDESGVHCAVGYLMQQTGYADLAAELNSSDPFVLVENLQNDAAASWLGEHGFSREEASLIQPGYGGFVIERVSYSFQDKLLAAATLILSLILVVFIIFALRLLRNNTIPGSKKQTRLIKLGAGSLAIIAGLIIFLPTPNQAVKAFVPQMSDAETIKCGGWNTPEGDIPAICDEFKDTDSIPGWHRVRCDGFC